MNLPNSLTVARLLMIPVFILAYSIKYQYADYFSTIIFVIAAITDGLDGYLARKKNQITLLGQFLDPVADKILVASALIILVETGRVPGWIVIIIVSREIAVTGLRAIAVTQGIVITPSRLGKTKTIVQIVAIVACLLNNYPFSLINFQFSYIALSFATVVTVWSGLDYFILFRSLSRKDDLPKE